MLHAGRLEIEGAKKTAEQVIDDVLPMPLDLMRIALRLIQTIILFL